MLIGILAFVTGIIVGTYLNDVIDNVIEEFFVD